MINNTYQMLNDTCIRMLLKQRGIREREGGIRDRRVDNYSLGVRVCPLYFFYFHKFLHNSVFLKEAGKEYPTFYIMFANISALESGNIT